MSELSATFYENESKSFSDTRFCIWNAVYQFGKQFQKHHKVLDAGCGNGKNIQFFKDKCQISGFDKSHNLVEICHLQQFNVEYGIVENIQYPDNSYDFVICVAVIHHIDTDICRVKAITEMMRVLQPGGKLLFTCWALETDEYSKKRKFELGDNLVPFGKNGALRYYHIFDETQFKHLCSQITCNHIEIFWERGNWNAILTK